MQTSVVAKTVVFGPDGKILLLKRSGSDVRRPLQWDIPGGHAEDGEFPSEAAARETNEETGIVFEPFMLTLVYAMTEAVSPDRSVTWLFHAAHTDQQTVRLSHEHEEYAWMALDDAIGRLEYERQKRALSYIRDHGLWRP